MATAAGPARIPEIDVSPTLSFSGGEATLERHANWLGVMEEEARLLDNPGQKVDNSALSSSERRSGPTGT